MALITFDQAKHQLRVGDEESEDVERKMEQATAIVILHIKRPNHGWTATTDPKTDLEFAVVQACILETLTDLYRNRGDDEAKVKTRSGLSLRVEGRLSRFWDPAIA